MGKKWLSGTVGAIAAVAIGSLAWAQGVQLLQSLTGAETISLFGGCTVSCAVTTNTMAGFARSSPGAAGFVNAILGGDYTTNPFQRGTSNGSAHISNTLTYGPADQWFIGAAGSSIDWAQNTTSFPARYGASLTMQRTAGNTDVNPICMGQAITSVESYRFDNNQAMMEIWVQTGTNYSGGAITATLAVGTGTDQSAASFAAGTWTNYAVVPSAALTGVSSTVAPNNATFLSTNSFTPNTTWTRYIMAFTVPQMVAAANVSQIGVKLCWTPSGTAGVNDYINLAAWQLEVNNTGVPTSFDHRPASVEFVRAAKFLNVINEPAAGVNVAVGVVPATNTTCQLVFPLVDQMRSAPSVTFAGTALSSSTWKIQTATALALATPFLAAGSGNTAAIGNATATMASASTSGFACALQGNGGGSKIIFSSEL